MRGALLCGDFGLAVATLVMARLLGAELQQEAFRGRTRDFSTPAQ
jgi:hypothetical protein